MKEYINIAYTILVNFSIGFVALASLLVSHDVVKEHINSIIVFIILVIISLFILTNGRGQ